MTDDPHRDDGWLLDTAFLATARVMSFLDRNRRHLREEDVITKPDGSPVTLMDLAGQVIYVMSLERALGDDGSLLLCGEETSDVLRGPAQESRRRRVRELLEGESIRLADDPLLEVIDRGGYRPPVGAGSSHWICDPIDGTRRFISGHLYSTCLAYVREGRLVSGAVGVPDLAAAPLQPIRDDAGSGTLVGARLGAGVFIADPGDPSRNRPLPPPATGLRTEDGIRFARSVGRASVESPTSRRLELAGLSGVPVEVDNQSKYAALVTGRIDLIARPGDGAGNRCTWDYAPGVLLARESGCRVADGRDRPFNFDTGPLLLENRGVRCAREDLYRACFLADGSDPVRARPTALDSS